MGKCTLQVMGERGEPVPLVIESKENLYERSEYLRLVDHYDYSESFFKTNTLLKKDEDRAYTLPPAIIDKLTAKRTIELLASDRTDDIIWRTLWVLMFFGGVEEIVVLLHFLLCENIIEHLLKVGAKSGPEGVFFMNTVLRFDGGVTASGWQVIKTLAQQFRIDPNAVMGQIQSATPGLVSGHKVKRFLRSMSRAQKFDTHFELLECRICLEKVHLKILTNWHVVGGALMVCCGAPVHRLCFWNRADFVGLCTICNTGLNEETGEIEDDSSIGGDRAYFRRKAKRHDYKIPSWVVLKPPPRFEWDHILNKTLNYPDLPPQNYQIKPK